MRRLRVVGVAAVAFLCSSTLLGALFLNSAAAHSSLRAAVPAVGLESGPFSEVRLEFFDPIKPGADINIDLRDSEGILLEGYLAETRLIDDFTIAAEMITALPSPGQYLVFFMIENDDGDGIQEAGYEFLFNPDADSAVITSNTVTGSEETEGAGGLELLGIAAALLGVIGVLFWFSPWWPFDKNPASEID